MKKVFYFLMCLPLSLVLSLARCSSPAGGDSSEPNTQLAITGLRIAPAVYGGEMTLSWTNPSQAGFDGVEISASPAGGSLSTPQILSKDEASYTATGLNNKTSYIFIIQPLGASGDKGKIISQRGTPSDTRAKGLYTGNSLSPEPLAPFHLAAALDWIKKNAQTNTGYTIVLDQNQTSGPVKLDSAVLNGKSDISVTLRGEQVNRVISLAPNTQGPLFTINARNKLVLDDNITLKGAKNNNSLVLVQDLGVLVMKGGVIRDNVNSNIGGGGVTINVGGSFLMEGGAITNNTTNLYGGGVLVEGGTFVMKGGTIRGNVANAYGEGVCIRRPNSATGKTTGTLTMSGTARVDIIGLYNSNPGHSSLDIGGGFTGTDIVARIDLMGEANTTIATWKGLPVLRRADGYTGKLTESRFTLGKDRAKNPIKGYSIGNDGVLR
jgi:hypothetical protein